MEWKWNEEEFKFKDSWGQTYICGVDRFADLVVCTWFREEARKEMLGYGLYDVDLELAEALCAKYEIDRDHLKLVIRQRDKDRGPSDDSYTQIKLFTKVIEQENGAPFKAFYGSQYVDDLYGAGLEALGFIVEEEENFGKVRHVIGINDSVTIPWGIKEAQKEAQLYPHTLADSLIKRATTLYKKVRVDPDKEADMIRYKGIVAELEGRLAAAGIFIRKDNDD